MDFFHYQEKARKRTALLVFFYILALLFLIVAVYALFVFLAMLGGGDEYAAQLERNPIDPGILVLVAGGISLLVLGGSFFKTAQLAAGGGRAVAEMLGGRQISPGSGDLAERRLYNVVEEIALAAGVPVPPIYVMDNEPSINAFAAGFSPNEAAISVNRGTMELLTRDELQGVLAHEFSHVVNGDMRISLRLIGILFGLQLLALIGYYALRLSYYASLGGSSRSSNDKGGGAAIGLVMMLAGIGVMMIGYIGVFFSSLIKAAISRQREFLADASAVQYTRMTDGIAGALKKIGCPNVGSDVKNEHAAEASHMFFGDVCPLFSLGGLLATHPDLVTRIKRLDPRFDGRFPQHVEPVNIYAEMSSRSRTAAPDKAATQTTEPLDPLRKLNPAGAMGRIGHIDLGQVLAAGALLDSIPKDIADSARNPLTAKAIVYAILLDSDEAIREQQLASLRTSETQFVVRQTEQQYDQLRQVSAEARIPLFQRVTASLRQMTSEQYKHFSAVVDLLIAANRKMDLFEYTLKAILLRDLDVFFGLAGPLTVQYTTPASIRQPFALVLAFLAYSGHDTEDQARDAFVAAEKTLGLDDPIPGAGDCTVTRFDQSLRMLAQTSPALKKQVFSALMTCIRHDDQITVNEGELIRAVAAMLAIPMPNFQEPNPTP